MWFLFLFLFLLSLLSRHYLTHLFFCQPNCIILDKLKQTAGALDDFVVVVVAKATYVFLAKMAHTRQVRTGNTSSLLLQGPIGIIVPKTSLCMQ